MTPFPSLRVCRNLSRISSLHARQATLNSRSYCSSKFLRQLWLKYRHMLHFGLIAKPLFMRWILAFTPCGENARARSSWGLSRSRLKGTFAAEKRLSRGLAAQPATAPPRAPPSLTPPYSLFTSGATLFSFSILMLIRPAAPAGYYSQITPHSPCPPPLSHPRVHGNGGGWTDGLEMDSPEPLYRFWRCFADAMGSEVLSFESYWFHTGAPSKVVFQICNQASVSVG